MFIPLEYAALAPRCVVLRSQPYYFRFGSHALAASISLKIEDVTLQLIPYPGAPLKPNKMAISFALRVVPWNGASTHFAFLRNPVARQPASWEIAIF